MTHLHVTDPLGGTVSRTVLPGGLRVITESIPTMRSATVGVWVGTGSRDETAEISGASHFLEHLLFKGTRRRSARDISSQIEAVGGETNAYTSKEYTCFYARVLDEDLPLALDVLADALTGSLLRVEDVEVERGVILEEIAMQHDDPGDEIHDVFAAALFGDHPLARDIAGTEQTVAALGRDEIHRYYRQRYTAPNMVVAAAGNIDHHRVVAMVEEGFAPILTDPSATPAPLRETSEGIFEDEPATVVMRRDTEQAHVVLGCRGLARRDDRRFAFEVLSAVLGGGMSSRLFQRIREEAGLAYSVYSYSAEFTETGLFAVYAGCAPENTRRVLELSREVLAEVAKSGIDDDELICGQGMIKGGLVLGLEDTGSRMSRLGRGELLFGDQLSVDEVLDRIRAVTVTDVAELAEEILTRPQTLAVSGPFDTVDF